MVREDATVHGLSTDRTPLLLVLKQAMDVSSFFSDLSLVALILALPCLDPGLILSVPCFLEVDFEVSCLILPHELEACV